MTWPLSQDFNEAIQNPSSAFMDEDLKLGSVTTTTLGVPLPRSGNYADVYQVTARDGKAWAVKCFTRAVAANLKERYAAIARHLSTANLPFTVGFEFLSEGIRVKGRLYPVLKMQWVDGQPLNVFVKENLQRATVLESMLSLWVRLCRRMRESGMAHCDLQHGNVILVPAEKANSLGLKLVDYDGMFVPDLADKPTGELGHASFQHPQRATANVYSADLDRFPHLVVATALRGLLVGGKALWEKYDTGDNLLFTAKDFTLPHASKVMRDLWKTEDPFTVGLLSHLVLASQKPLAATPWLDTLMPEGRPPVLTPSQERQAQQLLGLPVQGVVPGGLPEPVGADHEPESPSRQHTALPVKTKDWRGLYIAIAAGVLAATGIAVGVVALGGKKRESNGEVTHASSGPEPVVRPVMTTPEPTKEPEPPRPEPSPAVIVLETAPSPRRVILAAPNVPAAKVMQAPMPTPAQETPRKPSIPVQSDWLAAGARVREAYRELYAKKSGEDRKRLAEMLHRTALDERDPAMKYFCSTELQSLAIEIGDATWGVKALAIEEATFDVDGQARRLAFIARYGERFDPKSAAKIDEVRSLATACQAMADDLAARHDYDAAIAVAAAGLVHIERLNLQTHAGRDLEARRVALQQQKAQYEPVRAALEILKTRPEDAAARGTIGKFYCFVQERWAEGLPHLSACDDPGLKKAAADDLDTLVPDLRKGDGWWNWAQTQPEPIKSRAMGRARYWYRQVVAAANTGAIDRNHAADRIGFTEGGIKYRSGLLLESQGYNRVGSIAKKSVKLVSNLEALGSDFRSEGRLGVRLIFSGVIVPPIKGEYVFRLEGRCMLTTLKLLAKPDEKTLIDIPTIDTPLLKREGTIQLPAKPVPILLTGELYTTRSPEETNSLKLLWIKPGSKTAEPIPADVLYHDRDKAKSVTDK